jgi:microcystin-dependent protein
VVPFAGAEAPTGWLLCDGSAVSRTAYAGLFAAIGEAFGAGDGSGTFNLPDLRGRAVFSPDAMGGTAAGRLDGGALGDAGGAQTRDGATDGHVLTVAEMPAHSHGIEAVPVVAGNGDGGGWYTNTSNPTVPATTSVGDDGAHSHTISGFDVMPPYVLMNHIIKA